MKALVTGGAGFIGSHLVRRLLSEQIDVAVFDNLSTGSRANLEEVAAKIDFLEGDVCDADALTRHMAGCEIVFHQAAIVSVPYSVENPQETHDVNIQGTLNVIAAARETGVRRIIFACSAAVYGEEPELPKRETMAAAPVSPYGIEKITSEYYLLAATRLYGLEAVSLRYFNVFGPRQDPSSPYSGVISIFVNRALDGTSPTIYGNGEQSRDFVYVDNVVEANIRAATRPNASGRAYNIACGTRTTLNNLVDALRRITGKPMRPEYAPARPGDIRDSVADIRRAREELGFDPRIGVEEGLRRLLTFERIRRG